MDDPQRRSADGGDAPAAPTGPVLPPSRFAAGYTVGEPLQEHEPDSAAPAAGWAAHDASGWSTPPPSPPHDPPADFLRHAPQHFGAWPQPASPADGAFPGQTASAHDPAAGPSGWGQSVPVRRSNNGVLVLAVVAAVVLACGGFLAGRLTAPKAASAGGSAGVAGSGDTGAGPSAGGASTTAVAPSSAGLMVNDPAGDAVPHAVDGKVYGPSDIVSVSVRSDGTNLVIATVYTPSTPMDLVSGATRIRLNADTVPSCKDSVLDSFDWSIDYDSGGIEVSKPGANCGDRFQPTSITGAANISGTTLTVRVNQASLGIQPGQRIVVRACASTRIDSGHTTFIQDWAPDSATGTTGTV